MSILIRAPQAAPTSRSDIALASAVSRLGLSRDLLQTTFHDWARLPSQSIASGAIGEGYLFTLSGSATVGQATDLGPGSILRHDTGAVAGALGTSYGPYFFPRADTGKGYWKGRLKFEVAPDVATNIGWYLYSTGAASMGIAQIGGLSTTKIVFQYDGNVGGSKVDLLNNDTAWHDYEIWWLGDGKVHVAVDGVEVGTGVTLLAPITTAIKTFVYFLNGATAASRKIANAYEFMATTLV